MRSTKLLSALALAAGTLHCNLAAAQGIVDCTTFRTRWSAAVQAALPGQAPLLFERAAGDRRYGPAERLGNVADVDVRLVCREGKLGRLELRDLGVGPGEGASPSFEALASGVLVGLDGSIAPARADGMIAALAGEAARGRSATSEWGPYELTYGRASAGRRSELVLDLAEN